MAQVRLARVIPSMHVHLCVLRLGCFLLACLVLYFVPPFSFQPFLMFTSEFNERSRSNPLCDFRLGTVVTSDHETPLTAGGPSGMTAEHLRPLLECDRDVAVFHQFAHIMAPGEVLDRIEEGIRLGRIIALRKPVACEASQTHR